MYQLELSDHEVALLISIFTAAKIRIQEYQKRATHTSDKYFQDRINLIDNLERRLDYIRTLKDILVKQSSPWAMENRNV